ncbi:glutathione gamma-glutamylcysteinyltransferase 2 [Exaiptasia diaphana]|uniref:glutathione gamma-glutamylcysteinyltransferase n=1 Tax=Exaiptasia diaphana TaxID=2652724 RepID=A0A913XMA1_EXADI|nr:glutathione gamma-glutamylcysteinyltransferase 2 [Exaiptasia diaphana]
MVQKSMDVPTSYGYTLPSALVDYRSSESKKRLIRCINEGSAVPYFHISSCFKHQSHPAYCGISTLVVVLNALGIDPKKTWKNPWRWFTEDVIERSMDPFELDSAKKCGITVNDFQRLAEDNGASCSLIRAEDSEQGYEGFLEDLYKVCCGGKRSLHLDDAPENVDNSSHELNEVMAISFHRESLNQHGDGHFSPVAAYDLTTNSVLVLDTARFKYPPYWAPVDELYRSMIPKDAVTGMSRGYLVLGNPNKRIPYNNYGPFF